MSAANRTLGKRHASDFYETPYPLTEAALNYVRSGFGIYAPELILDPGAGLGVWGKAARGIWLSSPTIVGIEPERDTQPYYDMWYRDDYLSLAQQWRGNVKTRPDLIVGNPPYRLAQQFIEASRAIVAQHGLIVFLLRLNFLAGRLRREFWKRHQPGYVVVCIERPSFTHDGGSDATEYSLFVWGDRFLDTRVAWMSWRKQS